MPGRLRGDLSGAVLGRLRLRRADRSYYLKMFPFYPWRMKHRRFSSSGSLFWRKMEKTAEICTKKETDFVASEKDLETFPIAVEFRKEMEYTKEKNRFSEVLI